jgi:hypothetical protein
MHFKQHIILFYLIFIVLKNEVLVYTVSLLGFLCPSMLQM